MTFAIKIALKLVKKGLVKIAKKTKNEVDDNLVKSFDEIVEIVMKAL